MIQTLGFQFLGTVIECLDAADIDDNGNGDVDEATDEDLDGDGQLDDFDPFRPQLRRLLEVEFGNPDQKTHQLRLSINRLEKA